MKRNFTENTVENTHLKLLEKFKLINTCLDLLSKDNLMKYDLVNKFREIEEHYNLVTVNVICDYYAGDEIECTREYYQIITSENICSNINDIIVQIEKILCLRTSPLTENHRRKRSRRKDNTNADESTMIIETARKLLERAKSINIKIGLEKKDYEKCKCGTKMRIMAELSELHCENPICGRIKTIIGAIFRDDQFYPQEGQKTKHGGYDTSRHYRFWMERIQALETKVFDKEVLARIEYALARDMIMPRDLNCDIIREVLKDPYVNATNLNDHSALLVKTFGGRPPPRLDFRDNRTCSIKFNKAMKLYDEVNPNGGNKPYYPYFIYKIIEHTFRDDPEKLRLLNYIHLQGRDTVVKNDNYYKKICELASEEDDLVYTPTDPVRR